MPTASDLRLANADLEAMPEDGNRYEVIDGELFVSSERGFIHQAILMNIGYHFRLYLDQQPIGKIMPGIGVIFDEYTGVIPDLVFITNERMRDILAGGRLHAAPEIVIEILSPGATNERRDRHVKRNLYAARGVGEYWLFDPENRDVEVYRRNSQGDLLSEGTRRSNDNLTTPILPGFSVPASAFFE